MQITKEIHESEMHSNIGNRLTTKTIPQPQKLSSDAYDYAAIFVKWRLFIITTTLGITFLAWVVSLFLPKVYNAKTVVSLGSVQSGVTDTMGQIQVKITDVYSQLIFKKEIPKGTPFPKVHINFPKATSLMIINVSHRDPELALNSLKSINDMLLEDHMHQAEVARGLMQNKIYNSELNLKLLRDQVQLLSDRWKSESVSRENKVTLQKIALDKLNQKKETFLAKKKVLESSKQILADQLMSASQSMEQSSPNNKVYSKEKNSLPLLVLSNEFEKNKKYKDQLETKLNQDTPLQEIELQEAVSEAESAIKTAELKLNETVAENNIDRIQFKDTISKLQGRIQTAEQDLAMQRIEIDNMVLTKVLLVPTLDTSPIFPNKRNIILLTFFGALFSTLLISIFREGWLRGRIS